MPAVFSRRVLVALLAFCALAPYGSLMVYRTETGIFQLTSSAEKDWVDVQQWARNNSPIDSVFITPPYKLGFRVIAQRSPVVEWVDAGAMNWAPGFEREWLRRLGDLGVLDRQGLWRLLLATSSFRKGVAEIDQAVASYNSINESQINSIARRYGAKYVVRDKEGLPFPLVHANQSFFVYQIADSESAR